MKFREEQEGEEGGNVQANHVGPFTANIQFAVAASLRLGHTCIRQHLLLVICDDTIQATELGRVLHRN